MSPKSTSSDKSSIIDARGAVVQSMRIVDEEGGDFLHVMEQRFGYKVVKLCDCEYMQGNTLCKMNPY